MAAEAEKEEARPTLICGRRGGVHGGVWKSWED